MGAQNFGQINSEIGVDSDFGVQCPLRYPTMARWTDSNTCMIIDRCQPENRILEIDAAGTMLWETRRPPRMNTAVPVEHGRLAVSVNGTVSILGRDRMPTALTTVTDAVFESADALGAILALGSDAGIDILGLDGRARRRIRPGGATFTNPTGIELLKSGALLVADAWASRVVELDQAGNRIRSFGGRRSQGRGPEFLSGPRSACRTRDGATIVADTLAHRLVEFPPDGASARVIEISSSHGGLFAPTYVRECEDSTLLVADTGNRRVLRVARTGQAVWEFGPARIPRRLFSFPRSAEATGTGTVLVCDTFNHRVVEVRGKKEITREYSDGLVIPRSATQAQDGRTVIADGTNGRVLVLDRRGQPIREITSVRHRGARVPFQDPHLGRLYGNRLLIVDSDANAVWLIDEHDRVEASWGWEDGLGLRDPHYADFTRSGALAVTDSGNHRVLIIRYARGGSPPRREQPFDTGGLALRYPRFAQPRAHGGFLIADTDHSRMLRIEPRTVDAAGPILTARRAVSNQEIRTPRWLSPIRGSQILITDYGNSRIIVAALTGASRGRNPNDSTPPGAPSRVGREQPLRSA